MALSAKLQIRQSQSLVMTPQLLQSIRLLQYNHLELQDFIAREVEKNPLLEVVGEAAGEDAPQAPAEASAADGDWTELDTSTKGLEERLDTTLDNVFEAETTDRQAPAQGGDPWKSGGLGSGGGDGEAVDLDAWCASAVTLTDYLRSQAALTFRNPVDMFIAGEVIDSLDDDGYLRRDTAEMAASLGAAEARVLSVLQRIQSFDPSGVGARDLAECLSIQLAEKNRLDPAMRALLAHLDLLARRDYVELCRICGVDREDMAEMVGEIRDLEPRPGSRFGGEPARPVAPDVIVQARPDGAWSVELNAETLPRVLVDRVYFAKVNGACKRDEDKTFMAECLQNANWLVRSLDQRAQTILKVATEIVRQQDMFLANGVEYLRPLNLKTVADAIKMHESTVSRVTSNKYVLTPRGLFELKYFFTQAIASTGGEEAHSAEAVRHRIRQMIDAEAVDGVLSDDAIVEKLKAAGIDIARRTVAKYRESMNIPSSVRRRREKLAFTEKATA